MKKFILILQRISQKFPFSFFVIKRILAAVPLLIGVTFITFFLINHSPGDYLSQMALNPQIPKERIELERKKFGLDQPWHIRYIKWLGNACRLDFGYSFEYKMPVFKLIKSHMANTLLLSMSALLFAWLVAIPLGIIAAVKQYSWMDKVSSGIAFMGLSIPEVFLALLMVYFAYLTGWFPIGGMKDDIRFDYMSNFGKIKDLLHHLILPTFVLGASSLASYMRLMRGNLVEQLKMDYVTVARAKGLPEWKVVLKHAVRNAINPLITMFGYSLSSLLSGAFLVEIVMAWPGMGRLTINALMKKDIPLVVASVVMGSVMLIVGNIISDILLAISDPRIKYD